MQTEALARSCVSQLSALRRLLGLFKLSVQNTEYTLNLSTSDLASVGFHERRPHMHVHNPQGRDGASCAIHKRPNELTAKFFFSFFFFKKSIFSIPSYHPSARLGGKKKKRNAPCAEPRLISQCLNFFLTLTPRGSC